MTSREKYAKFVSYEDRLHKLVIEFATIVEEIEKFRREIAKDIIDGEGGKK